MTIASQIMEVELKLAEAQNPGDIKMLEEEIKRLAEQHDEETETIH